MANKKYMKEKPVRLFEQKITFKKSYPDSVCDIRGDRLFWYGKIQPTPLSQEYDVIVEFRMWESPKVLVVGENLQKLDAPDFPHKYNIDKENKMVKLCLYRYREFTSSKHLSKTIIPWTIEWLYYYELWLATNEWYGGGDHPNVGLDKNEPTEKQ